MSSTIDAAHPSKHRAIVIRVLFYCGAVLLILAVAQVQRVLGANLIEPLVTTLSSLKQAQLNALYNIDNLVTSLATAVLGGIGFFLVDGRKVKRWSAAMWLAVASAVCAAFSLYLGYVVYLALLDMLRNEIFNPDLPAILWARQAQFYFFLLAVALFGDFAFQALSTEDANEASHFDHRG